jgi:hypothetical protein
MTKTELLDIYFIETRARLLDLAALIDRLERAPGPADFRWNSLRDALHLLHGEQPGKTARILDLLSDPSTTPAPRATTQGACGAWPGYPPSSPDGKEPDALH